MPFAQIAFEETKSLNELIKATGDAWLHFRRFGRSGAEFGGEPLKMYKLGSGTLTVLGLLRDDGFVAETTFFDIYREKSNFPNELAALDNLRVDSMASKGEIPAAIFCCHQWDRNYQHFMVEEFPRIWAAANFTELAHLPIVVSDHSHIREMIEICFPERQFIFIKPEENINVMGEVYYIGAAAFNFGHIPKVLILALQELRKKVRAKAGLSDEVLATEQVFYGRRPNAAYAGNQRILVNYDECTSTLEQIDFSIRDFDYKSLVEKARLADGVCVAISPVGANLMNFIFLPLSANIAIIEHPDFKGWPFFSRLYAALGFEKKRVVALEVTRSADPDVRGGNTPYLIDIAALENDLEEFLFLRVGKKLERSIFIAGLSNGVFKDGYARGLALSTTGQVDNISLAASNCGFALWLNANFTKRVRRCEIAVFDFYIMDYKTSLNYVQRDIPELIKALPNGCLPVVILWPDQQGMTGAHEPTIAAYREACEAAGALFVDCRPLFFRVQKLAKLPSVDLMFSDSAHLITDYAKTVGKLIAAKISIFLRSPRKPNHIFAESLMEAEGLQVGPPWLRVAVSPEMRFLPKRAGRILGMMIFNRHHDFEIRIKDQRQNVFIYWDQRPDNPNPPQILRYVSIGTVSFEAGEMIRIETVADDKPVAGMEIASLLVSYD